MAPQPGTGQPGTRRRRVRSALRTSTRQAPEIVRGPGTTLYGQIEDWLAGEIAAGGLVPGGRPAADRARPGRVVRGQPDDAAARAGRTGPARPGDPDHGTARRDVRRRAQA